MTPEIQLKIDEALKYRDAERAWEVLVMAAKDSSLGLSRLDYLRLNYLRMNALDPDRLLAIMKESILAAYQIDGFDLEQRLGDYLELLDYIDIQVDFLHKLKAVIQDHEELLGDQKITVGGKLVAPTIANWLLDYKSMISSEMKDALGEMRYINTGPNLRILTIAQREALQNILKIDDRVSGLVAIYEEIPEKLSPEELKDFQDWAIEKYEEEYGPEVAEPVSTQPVAPPQAAPPQSIISQPVKTKPSVPVAIPTPETPKPANYTIPLQKDLDLSRQPKTGLVFDIPTNIDLDQEAIDREKREQEKIQAQKIQSKLEDLKKRKKS